MVKGCRRYDRRHVWQSASITRHASHVTRHTSHVTRHTSHVTRRTSHITRHTSHVTPDVLALLRKLLLVTNVVNVNLQHQRHTQLATVAS